MAATSQPMRAVRFCVHAVLTLLRWTLWLALSLVIAVQVYIACTNSLQVPGFILRALEERLAASGARITFGQATFDPSGRILIENAKFSAASFPEPIITARAVYGTIDPWALLEGRFEPKELKLTGVSVFIPAMLSASGRPEEAVKDLDAGLTLGKSDVTIDYLTSRLGNVAVTAHGSLHTGSLAKEQGTGALPLTQFLTTNFPALSRQIAGAITELSALDSPILHADLVPSDSRGALVRVSLVAAGFKLGGPTPLQTGPLRLVTRFPLLGDTTTQAPIDVTTRSLSGPQGLTASIVHARIRVVLSPGQLTFVPKEVALTLGSASSKDFQARAVFADLRLEADSKISGQFSAWLAGSPVAVTGRADLAAKSATLVLQTRISQPLLGEIGQAMGKDLLPFVNPVDPIALQGDVSFAPDWAFASFNGSVNAGRAHIHGVTLSRASGRVDLNRSHFNATEIYLALFEDYASGSYSQDLTTGRFRYLLQGKLRPMDISGWFGKWWPVLFANFSFPEAPPTASADVQGQNGDGNQAVNFIYVESNHPVVRGVPLDHARTRLFIRPFYTDGLEVYVTKGDQSLRGTYTMFSDPKTAKWLSYDFRGRSTLALDVPIGMFGQGAKDLLAPYGFEQPPIVDLTGHLESALAPKGAHQHLVLDVTSGGVFRLFGFPIDRAKALTTIDDDHIAVTGIRAEFAGGTVTGSTTLSGRGATQTLAFDAKLSNASLGQAITTVYGYDAEKNGRAHPPVSQFVKDRANVRFDLTASTKGKLSDISTFSGFGNAQVQGAELGKVQMLGLLSDVLKMTQLRFTNARANFSIEGARLVFPDISVTGANSAILAQGSYRMDTHSLDFNAKLSPFQQSNSVVKKGFGVLLSPLLAAAEMKLTGTIDNPSWNLAISPFNLFRASDSGKPAKPARPDPLVPGPEAAPDTPKSP